MSCIYFSNVVWHVKFGEGSWLDLSIPTCFEVSDLLAWIDATQIARRGRLVFRVSVFKGCVSDLVL